MPLFGEEVSRSDIENYINSDDFKNYHQKIKDFLDINQDEYEISIGDWAEDKEGFQEQGTMASTKPNPDYTGAETIVFHAETIKEFVNHKFGRVSDRVVLKEILIACIKYALTHELVHVVQLKEGKISKEEHRKNKAERKCKPKYEEDAEKGAQRILSRENILTDQITNIIIQSKPIDNNLVRDILDIYYKR